MVSGLIGIMEMDSIEQIEHLYFSARSGSRNWELTRLLGSVPMMISELLPVSFLCGLFVTIRGDVRKQVLWVYLLVGAWRSFSNLN